MKETPAYSLNFERWTEKRLASLSPARQKKVREFVDYMQISKFSWWTIKGNIQAILTLGTSGEEYEKLTENDLMQWIKHLELNGFSDETVRTYRAKTKHFLRWVHGCRSSKDPTPELLKTIRVPKEKYNLPKDILSVAEVQRLLATCGSQRNRALIHVGYESGCRASEVLGLKIRDIEFDMHGAVIVVDGKTGQRRIRLVESVHDLQIWVNIHPYRENPDAWLWLSKHKNRKDKPITVERLNGLLKTLARQAGIHKNVHPHLLRHTRASHLAKVLTEHQLRVYFGWSKTSDVPARYVHLSGRDVDETLLQHYGIFGGDRAKPCPRCGAQNEQEAIYCKRCSAVLAMNEAFNIEAKRATETELLEQIIKRLVERYPDIMDQVLREKEAVQRMESLKAGG